MDGARGASACVETKNLICSDHIIALSSPRTLRRPSAPHTRTPPPQHPPRTQMLTPRYQAPYPAPKYSWLGRSPPQFARQRAEPAYTQWRQNPTAEHRGSTIVTREQSTKYVNQITRAHTYLCPVRDQPAAQPPKWFAFIYISRATALTVIAPPTESAIAHNNHLIRTYSAPGKIHAHN